MTDIRDEMLTYLSLGRTRERQGGMVTNCAKLFAHTFAHILPLDLIVWLIIVTFEILMKKGMGFYFYPIAKSDKQLREFIAKIMNHLADKDEKQMKTIGN